MTNKKALKNLINSLDDIEIALLKERIEKIMVMTKHSIEAKPEEWDGIPLVSKYLSLAQHVKKEFL